MKNGSEPISKSTYFHAEIPHSIMKLCDLSFDFRYRIRNVVRYRSDALGMSV